MRKTPASGNTLVYSTDSGRLCAGCSRPIAGCQCRQASASTRLSPSKSGSVYVSRQTKGRAGKGVTVVEGLALGDEELASLARDLKARCATGGTVRDGVIELQGEHRDALVKELTKRGFAVKRSGG